MIEKLKILQIRPAAFFKHAKISIVQDDATVKVVYDKQEGIRELPKNFYKAHYEIVAEEQKKRNVVLREVEIERIML